MNAKTERARVLKVAIATACAALLSCAAIGAEPEAVLAAADAKASASKPAAAKPAKPAPKAAAPTSVTPQVATYNGPTEVGPTLRLVSGKSALVPLPTDAARLSVGNPEVADVVLINPREAYVVGRKVGTTNVFVWTKSGRTTLIDVYVDLDNAGLKSRLDAIMAGSDVKVASVSDSVVLSGRVSDAVKAERLVALANAYTGGDKKVVNMLTIDGSQQVMLEVKVAEVSKTLLDRLGVDWNISRSGSTTFTFLSHLLAGASNTLTASHPGGRTSGTLSLDAEVKNGLVKVLAEPTIMAVSGQEGAFLAGGKIFIPVPQSSGFGAVSITLEEKEFGVGLRFTPTVLDDNRINLRVTPEVSELSQVGVAVTSVSGQTNILPTITTRRASTTVQLRDGETFAIGGLIKNNVTEAVKALPVIGELPVLGALFRSSEFQTDRSELLFIVTPHLVKPMPGAPILPTDSFVEPTRSEFLLEGRLEGAAPPAPPKSGGFQMK
ncbi:MAG TPA: type II and III secretion system protein family protein [Usitatibacter sp.]|nr:type II and III secretion system protein family protein [Usitatibacter sp.]